MRVEGITLHGGEYLVTAVSSALVPGYIPLSPAESRVIVRSWVRQREASTLSDLLQALGSWRTLNPLDETQAFAQLVATRFDDHCPALLLYRREFASVLHTSSSSGADTTAAPLSELASRPEREDLRAWIEIQLEDRDGKPVPRARYEVRLSNRELRQGYLDQQGFSRIDGIPEGTCEVCFPDYDKSSWSHA
jgi:hypothetical protein